MPGDPILLLAANGLELMVGVGLVIALGLGDGWRALLPRLGLAYAVGLAVVGILDAELALAGVAVGLPQLALMAFGSLLAGRLLRRGRVAPAERSSIRVTGSGLIAAGTAGLTALLLGLAAASFSVRPLLEWDGWAIWGTKAQALYDFGAVTGPVFTGAAYAGIQQSYPLLLPSLEATDYRAMGAADGSVIHLQLVLFALAFAGGLVGLLWRRAPIELTCLCVLAVLTAPPVLEQLASNYADIPLAFFVALGLVALACWLRDDDPAMLALAAVFLGAGALTKDEGAMFAAAAFIPLLAFLALREGRRAARLLVAIGAVVAVLLPWRIFVSVHHLTAGGIQLSAAFHPAGLAANAARIGPSAQTLLGEIGVARFGLLVPLIAIALVAAFVTGRKLLASFAIAWLLLSFAAMVAVYWSSSLPLHWYLGTSAYRIVATLVVGAAALTPLLAADSWEAAKSGYGRKRSATSTETAPKPSRQVIFLPSAYDRP